MFFHWIKNGGGTDTGASFDQWLAQAEEGSAAATDTLRALPRRSARRGAPRTPTPTPWRGRKRPERSSPSCSTRGREGLGRRGKRVSGARRTTAKVDGSEKKNSTRRGRPSKVGQLQRSLSSPAQTFLPPPQKETRHAPDPSNPPNPAEIDASLPSPPRPSPRRGAACDMRTPFPSPLASPRPRSRRCPRRHRRRRRRSRPRRRLLPHSSVRVSKYFEETGCRMKVGQRQPFASATSPWKSRRSHVEISK